MTRKVKASATIEMAYIAPMVLIIVMLTCFLLFYYHDKNILAAAVYESAVVGSEAMREGDGITEAELSSYMDKRIQGKLIYFGTIQTSCKCREDQVEITVQAYKHRMQLTVEAKCPVNQPEIYIRNMKRLKEIGETE